MSDVRKEVEAAFPYIGPGWQVNDIIRRFEASNDFEATKQEILSEEILCGMLNAETLPRVVDFIAARMPQGCQ